MLSNLLPQTYVGIFQPDFMTNYYAFILEHKLKLVLVCYPTLSDSLTFGKVCLCVFWPLTTFFCCGLWKWSIVRLDVRLEAGGGWWGSGLITFTVKCCITVDHSLRHSLARLLSLVLHLHDDLLGGVPDDDLLLAGVLGAGGNVHWGLVWGESQSVN